MAEQKEQKQSTAVAIQEKTIADNVLNRIKVMETEGLTIPQSYSAVNALKSAWLMLQNTLDKDKKPVLQTCSKESVANTLLDMVIQGLSPAKKQCYFIAYGGQLQLSRSYLGTIAVTKRLSGIEDVFANIIFEGDEFEYTINLKTGLKEIVKHEQKFDNIDPAKMRGAYAVILRNNKPAFVEIMNIAQIKKAWNQGFAKGQGAHVNFGDEMAKKTVINRACKIFYNTSDDSDVLMESINRTQDIEGIPDASFDILKDEISDKANKEELKITPVKVEAPKSEPVEVGKGNGKADSNLFQDNEKAPF